MDAEDSGEDRDAVEFARATRLGAGLRPARARMAAVRVWGSRGARGAARTRAGAAGLRRRPPRYPGTQPGLVTAVCRERAGNAIWLPRLGEQWRVGSMSG